jgi:hypothetical protein
VGPPRLTICHSAAEHAKILAVTVASAGVCKVLKYKVSHALPGSFVSKQLWPASYINHRSNLLLYTEATMADVSKLVEEHMRRSGNCGEGEPSFAKCLKSADKFIAHALGIAIEELMSAAEWIDYRRSSA